jgi:hypothetical protein
MQGLRACHTGYRRGAGWTLPLGTLLNSGVMQPVNNLSGNTIGVAADAQTMASFFGATCANARNGSGPLSGNQWPGLCTACPVSRCNRPGAARCSTYGGSRPSPPWTNPAWHKGPSLTAVQLYA